ERWVGSCRRDLLDHVIVLNERHLKRLMAEYLGYYHEDRTHLGLAKDTPAQRPVAPASGVEKRIQSFRRLGGLHHLYAVAAWTTDFAQSPQTLKGRLCKSLRDALRSS